MKIAFATQDLSTVDAHFGWAKNIAVHDVTPDGHSFVGNISFDGDLQEDGNEDKLAPKLEAIADCAILYVAAIGGSAAARVVASLEPSRTTATEIAALCTMWLFGLRHSIKARARPAASRFTSRGRSARNCEIVSIYPM